MIPDGVGFQPDALRPASERSVAQPVSRVGGDAGFSAVLSEIERSELQFSGHARKRIEQRGLYLDAERIARLESAVERAAAKGSRDSLVLLDELALIVNIRSQTVITAMDEASRKEHVFTNIDSVVIAD